MFKKFRILGGVRGTIHRMKTTRIRLSGKISILGAAIMVAALAFRAPAETPGAVEVAEAFRDYHAGRSHNR